MKWTEQQIKHVIAELAEENPLACKALLRVAVIEFTDKVPTMAVSLSGKPVLLINRNFCDTYLLSENDIKTVLVHEFLHVLLMHTEKFDLMTPLLNIALDAIINSIIHRLFGIQYSGFFDRFYTNPGITCLLRPNDSSSFDDDEMRSIHEKIYAGKICADDLYELIQYLMQKGKISGTYQIIFLGNHSNDHRTISPEAQEILNRIMKKMDGSLIWSKPGLRGIGDKLEFEKNLATDQRRKIWREEVYRILKKCLSEDRHQKNSVSAYKQILPVLNAGDTRAIAKFSWSGMIPFAISNYYSLGHSETANVYLDVSGSMVAELNLLIPLLYQFRKFLRKPFCAFSDVVTDAKFINGELDYKTSGGTSISCVFDHIRKNKIKKNIVITDGFIEDITPEMLTGINISNLFLLVSAEGDTSKFHQHGIKYYQLKKMNQ